jgi:hypothetical protein
LLVTEPSCVSCLLDSSFAVPSPWQYANNRGRPMKKKSGTSAGIPRASGERNSPTGPGNTALVSFRLLFWPSEHLLRIPSHLSISASPRLFLHASGPCLIQGCVPRLTGGRHCLSWVPSSSFKPPSTPQKPTYKPIPPTREASFSARPWVTTVTGLPSPFLLPKFPAQLICDRPSNQPTKSVLPQLTRY